MHQRGPLRNLGRVLRLPRSARAVLVADGQQRLVRQGLLDHGQNDLEHDVHEEAEEGEEVGQGEPVWDAGVAGEGEERLPHHVSVEDSEERGARGGKCTEARHSATEGGGADYGVADEDGGGFDEELEDGGHRDLERGDEREEAVVVLHVLQQAGPQQRAPGAQQDGQHVRPGPSPRDALVQQRVQRVQAHAHVAGHAQHQPRGEQPAALPPVQVVPGHGAVRGRGGRGGGGRAGARACSTVGGGGGG
mmetsp:Transcript_1387/g.4096  ORF Transcript_1387/g.4096 Transcript_1387/m.4096 type:complete len:248 (-) Transcript_1387:210-953(-)